MPAGRKMLVTAANLGMFSVIANAAFGMRSVNNVTSHSQSDEFIFLILECFIYIEYKPGLPFTYPKVKADVGAFFELPPVPDTCIGQ